MIDTADDVTPSTNLYNYNIEQWAHIYVRLITTVPPTRIKSINKSLCVHPKYGSSQDIIQRMQRLFGVDETKQALRKEMGRYRRTQIGTRVPKQQKVQLKYRKVK